MQVDIKNVLAGVGGFAILVLLIGSVLTKTFNEGLTASLLYPDNDSSLITATDLSTDAPEESPLCGFLGNQPNVSAQGFMTIDNVKNIYFTDGTVIKKIDKDGKQTVLPGSYGGVRGMTSVGNDVYFSDVGADKIYKIDNTGKIKSTWGTGYKSGGTTSYFFNPSYITYNQVNKFFYIMQVGESAESTLDYFTLTDNSQAVWQGKVSNFPKQFFGGMAIDVAGNLYVADGAKNTISKYTNHKLVKTWGGLGTTDGKFNFASATRTVGMTFGPDGNLYVTDVGNNRVQVFDINGNFVTKFGVLGSGTGESMNTPTSIVFDANGNMYVLDQKNYRINTYTNPCGIVKVVKEAYPKSNTAFDFFLNPQIMSFKLTGNGSSGSNTTFSMMNPFSQQVIETKVSGYNSSVSCDLGSGALSAGEKIDYKNDNKEVIAYLTLYRGQKVTCTFKNECIAASGSLCPEYSDPNTGFTP